MPWNNAVDATQTGVQTINNSVWTGSTFSKYTVLVGSTSNGIVGVSPSATVGYALVSNGASANPSFQQIGFIGTANQVLVNNTSGSTQQAPATFTTPQNIGTGSNVQFGQLGLGGAASSNTLSITGKASIGYGDTAAPTDGLIVSGSVGFGTTILNGYFTVAPAGITAYNYMGLITGSIIGNSSSSPVYGLGVSCGINPNYGGSIANCNAVTVVPNFSPALGCTISNGYGIYVSAGSQGGAGAVTNGYSLRVFNPNYGSNYSVTAYFDPIVTIGTGAPASCATLHIVSTTKGVILPKMNQTQKTNIVSPVAGLIVYDTTADKLCVYTPTGWQTISSA